MNISHRHLPKHIVKRLYSINKFVKKQKCFKKRKYLSAEDAKINIDKNSRIYKCDTCGYYHRSTEVLLKIKQEKRNFYAN
jgi:hypothetical protein